MVEVRGKLNGGGGGGVNKLNNELTPYCMGKGGG